MPEPPEGLGNCAVSDCFNPATTTRPMTHPWITPLGAVLEGDEWVCALHEEAS